MELNSPNFQFLEKHDPHLLKLAAGAEAYCFREPDISLTRSRQLAEAIAFTTSRFSGESLAERPDFFSTINALRDDAIVSRELADAFHTVRTLGNEAVHSGQAQHGKALHALKLARSIAVWFHRLTNRNFKPGAFVPPPQPVDTSAELAEELDTLKTALASERQARASAEQQTISLEQAHAEAEAETAKAYQEQQAALDLAAETEQKWRDAQARFLAAEQQAPQPSQDQKSKTRTAAQEASSTFLDELDEAETREIIDAQLRAAGWEADTLTIRYSHGTRPEKGKNKAIAEWPTASGPVDYALFAGLQLVAVAEAKRFGRDLPPVLGQARRYAANVDPKGFPVPDGSPWLDLQYRVPFAFAANGRPYLRQLEEKSGIHFHDLRSATNHPFAIDGWRSPEGLLAELDHDTPAADAELATSPVDLPGLRPYQIDAITAVEHAIAAGARELLLAMATGTGKTRTAISLIYRLVKAKRFRRILFLVDRTELGTQAFDNGFDQIKLDSLQTFSNIYNVLKLGQDKIEPETRVHIATVQSMLRSVTRLSDVPPPPVDRYDCVIIDECHRGYNLDRDMADHELTFRSEADFISKYRRVVDHFHAVKIGLTATPAQHTTDIFGRPVYTYSYREAVTDGFLCDHEPPVRIVTALAKHGIKWRKGDKIKLYNPKTATIDLVTAPDEVLKNVDAFNTQVITKPFNETVCAELANHLNPTIPGKTLVFCATDSHADIFVTALKNALDQTYGPQPDTLVAKITGTAVAGDSTLIRRFKNETHPKIVVTVDLLTTGIDVPEITKLVFVRQVNSRILYEQMLGRATRLCHDLFGEGEHKESFEIFDAVDLYDALQDFSTMQPVVQNATATIPDLTTWLQQALEKPDAEAAAAFHDELTVKIRRRLPRIERNADELAARFSNLTPDDLIHTVAGSPTAALDLFARHPELPAWIQSLTLRATGGAAPVIIAEQPDALDHTGRGYGDGRERPEDYLTRFNDWIAENQSTHQALQLVLTAPASLTRADLKKLALAMDDEGFTEIQLRPAWREVKHQDCAARLIGYIRAQALGSPLIPFEDRVDRAADRLRASTDFQWTHNQRLWLDRIIKQIKKSVLVDRDALNHGAFKSNGGYNAINKSFSGKLDHLLKSLHTQIWTDDVA